MDALIDIALPLSLAVIMLSLGIGLEVEDFTRVARRGRAFAVGALCQMVALPLVALAVLGLLDLPPEMATGVFLLALCPGGVTSNILSKLARGDVALSVSLTAVMSLVSILTVPVLAAWGARYFMAEAAPQISVAGLAVAMFLITTLPVALGVALRRFARGLALRVETGLSHLATALFVLIVVAALATNWTLFVENVVVLDEVLISLCALMLALGLGAGWLAGLAPGERKTIAIETGIQNATLGITLAALISGTSGVAAPMALPSAVYGILMYLIAGPFILLIRGR